MSILKAAVLFGRANDLRMQLDHISGHKFIYGEDLLLFNNLLRVFDKIYMSENTREHRLDLKNFILLNGDAIYKKYLELNQKVFEDEAYNLKIDI